ncbi:hypothetical protein [Vibrio sp. HA2012]|uniref:hypothetical protein n=1 Tax=Vibrio sp. HA2012 TaxID=1971595 RepID=UPI0012FDD391|nr:hypothetical protein [Vibrio sp. HA2012]
MKLVQADRSDIKKFVASLYENGKTPSERFGMTWNSLSQLEKDVPELTEKECQTA